MVSGVGYDNAVKAGPAATRYQQLRQVVSNLAPSGWDLGSHRLRPLPAHPGVSAGEVTRATGSDLVILDDVPATREPAAEELDVISDVIDPHGARYRKVPA